MEQVLGIQSEIPTHVQQWDLSYWSRCSIVQGKLPVMKSPDTTAKLKYIVTLHSRRDSLMRDKYLEVYMEIWKMAISMYFI